MNFSFLFRVPESPKEEEEEGPFFARFSDETFLTRCARKRKYLILQSQKIFFEGKGSVLQSNFAILWFVVTTEGLYPNHDVSNVCFSKSKAICVEHFDEFQKQF